MGEPSTKRTSQITIPSKTDQYSFVQKHWNIHHTQNERTPLEQQYSLKDCPDPSCLDCFPKPVSISDNFDTFFQTIAKYQDITDYTGRTVELFEKYIEEEDSTKRTQLAVTVAVSLVYGRTYWQGATNLSDIVDLIETYQKGELILELEEEEIADTSFIQDTEQLYTSSLASEDIEEEKEGQEQEPTPLNITPQRKEKQPLLTPPRTEIRNYFNQFHRPDTPINRPRNKRLVRPTMTTSTTNNMDLLAQAMTRLTEHITNVGTSTSREYTLMKIDSFSGDEQDPMEWWQTFEKAAKANNWSNARQLLLAPTYLRRTADSWYKSLVTKPATINNFKRQFLEQFRTTTKVLGWRSELDLCRQKDDETVTQYAGRFRDLLEKIYPGVNQEEAHLHQFIRGMKSEIIRLGNVASKTTFNTALEAAKTAEITHQYSAISEALNPTIPSKSLLAQQETTQMILQEIANLKEALTASTIEKPKPTESRPWNNGQTCFDCGSPDHFRRFCPKNWRSNGRNKQNNVQQ